MPTRYLLVAEVPTMIGLGGQLIGLEMHDALLLGRAEIATLESDRAVIVAELFGMT